MESRCPLSPPRGCRKGTGEQSVWNLEERHSYKIIYILFRGHSENARIGMILLVGAGRFERPTPCAQGRCATRLRYAPTFCALLILNHFLNLRYWPACPNGAKNPPTVAKT